jgi:hypothetical protein
METPVSIKLGNLFFIVVICAFTYAIIYWRVYKLNLHDAIYKSVAIQTLSGNTIEPVSTGQKFLIVSQFLIAYLLTTGLIVVSIGAGIGK